MIWSFEGSSVSIQSISLHLPVVQMHPWSSVTIDVANDADMDLWMDLHLGRCLVKCVASVSAHPNQESQAFVPYYAAVTELPTIDDASNVLICPFEHLSHGNDFVVSNPIRGIHLHPSVDKASKPNFFRQIF